MLLYSFDNGTTWLPIVIDLAEPTYTFSPALIQGGDQVHFRVVASDGFNSSEAQEGPITVTQQPGISPPEDPVDTGKAVVGDQVIGQVVLENRGTGPLEVDSVANDQPEFEGLFPQGPFSTPKLVRVTSKILQISSVPRPYAQVVVIVSIPNDQARIDVPDKQRGER